MYGQLQRMDPAVIERAPTLREVLAPLFRHRRLVVLSFLGIFLAVVASGLLLPKEYEAQMKILVKRERVDPVVTPDHNALLPVRSDVTEEELNSEGVLLKSWDLLEKVVLTCGLHLSNRKPFWTSVFRARGKSGAGQTVGNDSRLAQAVRTFENKLHVEPLKKTNLIRVTYQSSDAQLAARVLTTLADLYLEKHLAVHRPVGALDFFERETHRYQEELGAAEARLTSFDNNAGVVSAQLEKEITLRKLTDFEATLRVTQAAVAETENRIRELEKQLSQISPRLITQIRELDNAGLLQQLKSTLLNLELKRTELLEKFEPSYRPVQEVEKQIAQTRAAITAAEGEPVREETTDRDPAHEWLRAELTRSKTELAGLHARAAVTAQVVRAYLEKAHAIDQKGTVQQSLIRAAKASEDNYLLYLRKHEEARISDALDQQRIVNVSIAETATVPALPSHPLWSWTLLPGFLVASLVSAGLAFASEYLNPSFRTPDELRGYLDVPVLAAIPKNDR